MRAGVAAAVIAASIWTGGAGLAACPPGQSQKCVNLDLVPQITQRIVAHDRLPTAPKAYPAADQQQPYTGPTVGAAPNLHRAPTVGYRWAIN